MPRPGDILFCPQQVFEEGHMKIGCGGYLMPLGTNGTISFWTAEDNSPTLSEQMSLTSWAYSECQSGMEQKFCWIMLPWWFTRLESLIIHEALSQCTEHSFYWQVQAKKRPGLILCFALNRCLTTCHLTRPLGKCGEELPLLCGMMIS